MEYREFSAKTVEDAITSACQEFLVTSDNLDYVVVEEGSTGFLGIGSKPAVIKARAKEESLEAIDFVSEAVTEVKATVVKKEASCETCVCEVAKDFLADVFEAMNMNVTIDVKLNKEESSLDIDLSGDEMGVLIGKRGQTLDSLQYLVSLVVNKKKEEYLRVKIDTENYRQRRKDTLENLAKNIAYKVKRTKRSVSIEPMNPYERRIIHSALQNDRYVTTPSEGEEPFRRVVVSLKK